ncbi:AMP-binding protein, partial [Shewanella sp. C31]|nr:AMP-binding protein [Shewanella electrica]
DKVATLAWNTQGHMEAWYGAMGMGAVCHTLNPRLTAEQLAWMAGQSGARVLIASVDLLPLARRIAELAPPVERLLVIDGAAEAEGEPGADSLEA